MSVSKIDLVPGPVGAAALAPDVGSPAPASSGAAANGFEDQPRLLTGVDRALYLLAMFATTRRADIGVTEIAQELGVAKSSIHRVLFSLRSREVLTFDPVTKRYALGRTNMTFGRAYLKHSDVRAVAGAHVPALAERTGATVGLALVRGGSWLYIDQFVPPSELRVELPLGRPHDLGESSPVSLAFLAHLAGERDVPLVDSETLEATALEEDVARVRAVGYAVSDDADSSGTVLVAAPIVGADGEVVAVLVLTGPRSRLSERREEMVHLLRETVSAIADSLSGRR